MPLEVLVCTGTNIRDVSPLKGMPLKELCCDGTEVVDLSPLEDLPLRVLRCDVKTAKRNAEVIRSMRTSQVINRLAAAEFWKKLENP